MDSLRNENEEEEGLVSPEGENEEEEKDDAALRRLANQAEVGPRTPEYHQQLVRIAAAESRKWNSLGTDASARPAAGDGSAISPTPMGTATWSSLGPGTARSSYNGTYYRSIDTGRITKIRVKPNNAKTVYIATAGGGVWKATDFGQYPTWQPITDQIGTLAVGALDLDPNDGKTVWIGLGDAYDQQGGGLVKSTDEGQTWGDPILLSATHPVDGQPTISNNVRDIAIDPTNTTNILVASNDGFYRSTDAGATFNFIDLPNTAATGPVREATWSLVFLGKGADGNSQWLLSGAYACPGGQPPHPASGTQNRLLSTAACASNPAVGNYGDIWKSTDSGATWVSTRASGLLPASVTGSAATDVSLIHMAASGTADPAATVVYAIGGSLNDTASATNAVLKSVDGGNTWTVVATKSTAVTNPTTLTTNCRTTDMGQGQSWYDLAIGVDPADANRVLIGGSLCGARTIDGGATWQLVAHWLPQGGSGYTAEGFLPYVHADWHTATITRIGGVLTALVGHDGGLSVSRDLFDAPSGTQVNWHHPNIGVVTHLPYSVGSGDPVYGNASVVFSGLQDNGTRFRLLEDESFMGDWDVQNWDQIRGGDGIGTAVAGNNRGQNPVYWISVQGQWWYCQPRMYDCSRATRIDNGVETSNYRRATVTLPAGDSYPFMIRYSPTFDERSSVIATTSLQRLEAHRGSGVQPPDVPAADAQRHQRGRRDPWPPWPRRDRLASRVHRGRRAGAHLRPAPEQRRLGPDRGQGRHQRLAARRRHRPPGGQWLGRVRPARLHPVGGHPAPGRRAWAARTSPRPGSWPPWRAPPWPAAPSPTRWATCSRPPTAAPPGCPSTATAPAPTCRTSRCGWCASIRAMPPTPPSTRAPSWACTAPPTAATPGPATARACPWCASMT